ncbi:MAG: YlbF family regulator, partial [Acholeplasmatales bacterium]|nr:YlbF family regulator [Acholeplasmatales bacterium]
MINLDNLDSYFENDSNLKRLHELEIFFDNNSDVKELIKRKQHISKELVNARILNLKETCASYKKEYDEINQEISEYPLLEEYLELLDIYHNEYLDIISYLENTINKKLEA